MLKVVGEIPLIWNGLLLTRYGEDEEIVYSHMKIWGIEESDNIMSKKLNLSPIAIIVSLLVFEHLFGIVGMIIATPAVAIIKIIYVFLDEKYNFFEFDDQEVK